MIMPFLPNPYGRKGLGIRIKPLNDGYKYDFKANPFKEKDGKPVLYPAVVVKEGQRIFPVGIHFLYAHNI